MSYYAASTEHDSNWYKAWHAWAVMNFETCLFYRQQQHQPVIAGQQPVQSGQQENKTALSPQTISNYAVPALKGFVRSISLSKGSSLQDTLRLLTLLFDYGHQVRKPVVSCFLMAALKICFLSHEIVTAFFLLRRKRESSVQMRV